MKAALPAKSAISPVAAQPARAAAPTVKPVPLAPTAALQQTLGNRALGMWVRRRTAPRLQTRLKVGQPGDVYEQEADRVAEQVLHRPALAVRRQGGQGAEGRTLRRLPGAGNSAVTSPAPPGVTETLQSAGAPLPAAVRAFFEPRFGYDFSGVRVHTDARAAASAQAVSALAYTVGPHIVLGAGQYRPHASAGRHLLAHELTHVVQQNMTPPHLGLQRQLYGSPATVPCDLPHTQTIQAALVMARTWRRRALTWLSEHLDHLRRRTPPSTGAYAPVGTTVFNDLALLEQHFRISEDIRHRGSLFPGRSTDPVNARDLENFGNASYWIRRRFDEVELSSLAFQCQAASPRGRTGSDVLGSAEAGSRLFTIYTSSFDRHAGATDTQAGVVLHEAFHASFSEFTGDTYSFERGRYPGLTPLTNAESYAMFAAVTATGHTYRIVALPEMTISGSPAP